MSRRFGRNQKRRMRAELAEALARETALHGALKRRDADLAAAGQMLRRLQDNWQAVREALPANTVLVEAEIVDARHDPRVPYAMPRVSRAAIPAMFPSLPVSLDEVTFDHIELLKMEVVQDYLENQRHIYVTLADKTVAYGITRAALKRDPRLFDRLRDALARELVKHFQGSYPR